MNIEQLNSLRRILRAIAELRLHELNATAEILEERVKRAFPAAGLIRNPLDGHIQLWGERGLIASSEEQLS